MNHASEPSQTAGRHTRPHVFGISFCFLTILLLALAAPVSAAIHTISPGDSIQAAVSSASPGDTIILNPGTYSEHDIVISRAITIRANTSAGGSPLNTAIDAGFAGRIFDDNAGYDLTIDNLTMRNGRICCLGGAVLFESGNLTVTSSSFSNCTALPYGAGGAIYALGGHTRIIRSTFSECAAQSGGAIDFDPHFGMGDASVISSSFSNCSASVKGGAIYVYGSTVDIRFSRFYHANATGGTVSNEDGGELHGIVSAMDNWWGTNANPSGFTSGGVITDPWLMLNLSATPSAITDGQTSAVRASLRINSNGEDTSAGGIFVPDGIPASFAVSGGSGSLAPAHTVFTDGIAQAAFTSAGAGTSTVAVIADGQTAAAGITVTSPVTPPVANFTADQTSGLIPLSVRFTDMSAGSPETWNWSFGDGNISRERNTSHTYTIAGNYSVSLTVTNAAGSDTKTLAGYIQATAPVKPVAAFTANRTTGKKPLAVRFTDQSTGSPTSWKWTFGDGSTSTLQNPAHTYARAGTYTVSLTAKNAKGSDTKTRTGYIRVTNG